MVGNEGYSNVCTTVRPYLSGQTSAIPSIMQKAFLVIVEINPDEESEFWAQQIRFMSTVLNVKKISFNLFFTNNLPNFI